jgi:AcrR family transcriptional regulator
LIVDRAQLVEAAARVIRSEGPDATMAEIAAEATVTKPILYRAVGDRRALTFALSEMLIDRINTAVATQRAGQVDPRSEFEAAVRGYLAAIDVDRNLFLFVNGGSQDTEVIRELVDRSAVQLIDLFTAARVGASRDAAAAKTWAYAIVGAFQVVTLMWLRDDYCDLDTVVADLTQLLWPGVATAGD